MKDFRKQRRKTSHFFALRLLTPFFLLYAVFIGIEIFIGQTQQNLTLLSFRPSPLAFSPAPYPVIRDVLGMQSSSFVNNIPSISAKAYIVVDDRSKVVVAAKNPNDVLSMASTVKLMTAVTGLSYFKPYDILTIKSVQVSGSVVGFTQGDTFYFEDLLYSLLLPSGNDAAEAIADNYPGGKEAFVAAMNENASLFHLTNTYFVDPAGLEEKNYSTVFDLARLSSIVLKNQEIAKVVNTKRKIITNVNQSKTYVLDNLNKLLGKEGVNGIKTGFTDEALGVLTTSQIINEHPFIVVVMNSKERFADTEELLRSVTQNVAFFDLVSTSY